MIANERTVSVRVTEEQFNILQKEAKARKLTVSNLLRETIFPSIGSDAFQSFKADWITTNQEMSALLVEMMKHVRFSSSVTANLFSQQKPEAVEKLQKIHDAIFGKEVNDDE